MISSPPGLAALRMYDLPEIQGAVDRLWALISARLPEPAPRLTWEGDLVGQWTDPNLVLGQSCGWPMATFLASKVTVVGAFSYRGFETTPGPRYRSIVVASADRPLASFAGGVAAINAFHSLSGWVSLAHAVGPHADRRPFFDKVIVTGAHVVSLARINEGSADLAAIDGVTYRLLQRHRPTLVEGLAEVGAGPLIPTLPLVTASVDPGPLRAAIAAALDDPAAAEPCADLLIEGFHPVDDSAYAPVRELGRLAVEVIPPEPE